MLIGSCRRQSGRRLTYAAGRRSIVNGRRQSERSYPCTADSTPDSWPWPDPLHAMIAAPGFHTVLFENLGSEFSMGVFQPAPWCPYTPTVEWRFLHPRRPVTCSAEIPMGMCWPIPGHRNLPRLWAQPPGAPRLYRIPKRRHRGVPHPHRGDERRRTNQPGSPETPHSSTATTQHRVAHSVAFRGG